MQTMCVRYWLIIIVLLAIDQLIPFTDLSSISSVLGNKDPFQGVLNTESTMKASLRRVKPKLTWHSEPSECVETVKTKGADVERSIFLLIYHWMLKLEGGHHVRSLRYGQMLYDLSVLMIHHDWKKKKKLNKNRVKKCKKKIIYLEDYISSKQKKSNTHWLNHCCQYFFCLICR